MSFDNIYTESSLNFETYVLKPTVQLKCSVHFGPCFCFTGEAFSFKNKIFGGPNVRKGGHH